MSVRAAFAAQGVACAALGSPFMERLMGLIGARLSDTDAVGARVLHWPGDPRPGADSLPLRLAGALHGLKLEGLALNDVYPPAKVSDDRQWAAIEAAMRTHEARVLSWLDAAPQTNEVRRAAAILPVLADVGARFGLPVELLELGASAGLNLYADRFRLNVPGGGIGPEDAAVTLAPDWQGPAPGGALPRIIARRGVDLNPPDPFHPKGRLRLCAYLWPDQPERLARTEAAIEVAQSWGVSVDKGDAGAWTEAALSDPAPDRVRLLYHTVAWQYFPEATRARAEAAMAAVTTPLVRFGIEADGGTGAALTLTTYPGGDTRHLGRADFHGRWVRWSG